MRNRVFTQKKRDSVLFNQNTFSVFSCCFRVVVFVYVVLLFLSLLRSWSGRWHLQKQLVQLLCGIYYSFTLLSQFAWSFVCCYVKGKPEWRSTTGPIIASIGMSWKRDSKFSRGCWSWMSRSSVWKVWNTIIIAAILRPVVWVVLWTRPESVAKVWNMSRTLSALRW